MSLPIIEKSDGYYVEYADRAVAVGPYPSRDEAEQDSFRWMPTKDKELIIIRIRMAIYRVMENDKMLYQASTKAKCVIWAEGRQSVTQQKIKMGKTE